MVLEEAVRSRKKDMDSEKKVQKEVICVEDKDLELEKEGDC